jgi:hypothetical protein
MRLLYFSPVAWDSYAQRPHYFAREFLAQGGRAVVWVDPYPTRLPRLADLRRPRPPLPRPPPPPKGLAVVRLPALAVDPLPGGKALNARLARPRLERALARAEPGAPLVVGVGRPGGVALAAVEGPGAAWRFYDAMDDFPEFYAGWSRRVMRRREATIARKVERLFVSSARLEAKFSALGLRPRYVPNAYDMASLPPPAAPPEGRPVLGYIGTIGEWFDWEMVGRLAEALPTVTVRLIGPRFVAPPARPPANLEILPACPQEEAPRHLADFSAGLVPFRRSPLTDSVDPIKYYEYRAMGLPVLSTSFGEMARRGEGDFVFRLDGGEPLAAVVGRALAARPSAAEVEAFRRGNDWRERLAGLFAGVAPAAAHLAG